MDKVSGSLHVFFEGTFWIGVFERVENGRLSVCKVTFGAEPKDYEIQAFILQNYFKLRFSPSVTSAAKDKERINPKRIQREVQKETRNMGIGTKSQQALNLQHEQGKLERKQHSREQREAEKEFRFECRQQKRKKKHKGR